MQDNDVETLNVLCLYIDWICLNHDAAKKSQIALVLNLK